MGLLIFKSFWSSVGFLSNGVTSADLKHAGTYPSISDLLIILVIDGIRSSTHIEKREFEIGSKSQDFNGAFKIIDLTYSSDTGSKGERIDPSDSKTAWIYPKAHHIFQKVVYKNVNF